MAIAQSFVSEVTPSNVVQTSGSILLVGKLDGASEEPAVATLTVVDTAIVAGDEVLTLSSDSDVTLRRGLILKFTTGANVVVAETTSIAAGATAVSVPVEPLVTPLPANGNTAQTWGLLRVLSPTALPLTSDSTNVDRKDYTYGLQGSEVKTRVNLNSSVQIINQATDRAYYEVIHPATQNASNVFVMIVTNAEHAFGACQVSSLTDDNAIDEISRPSFDLMFQAPFARVGAYSYLEAGQKTKLNEARALAGLAALT
jgi:hypothetical protein